MWRWRVPMQVWKSRVERAARSVVLFGTYVRAGRSGGCATNRRRSAARQPWRHSREIAASRAPAKRCDHNRLSSSTCSFLARIKLLRPAIARPARSTEAGGNRGCGAHECRWNRSVATRGRGHCSREAAANAHHRDQDCRDHRSSCCRGSGRRPDRSYWQQTSGAH